ncbi:hypothetical protein Agub_g5847, partial [Astrephomene gubernaculifera]
MFGDLSLPLDDVEPPLHRERVAALLSRGYDVVATVHNVTGRISEADRCTSAPLSLTALAAASSEAKRILALCSGSTTSTLTLPPSTTTTTTTGAASAQPLSAPAPPCPLRQLSRLNLVASDAVTAAQLAAGGSGGAAAGNGAVGDIVRSYDIVSITPKNERVLHQAATSLEVDVVSLELSQRLPLKLRPPTIKAALRRGIYFEICYAPALREPTARRNFFCNTQALVRA